MKTLSLLLLSLAIPCTLTGSFPALQESRQGTADLPQWSAEEIDNANTGNAHDYLESCEQATLMYINFARLYPKKFAEIHLKPYCRLFDGRLLKRAGKADVLTLEGLSAVTECIAELNSRRSVRALVPSAGLTRAARDHVRDQGAHGVTGHEGSDGSMVKERIERYGVWEHSCGECISYGPDDPLDVVIQLLVDDAVPERGHRESLLDRGFTRVGLSCGVHKTFHRMCVVDLAGVYGERK